MSELRVALRVKPGARRDHVGGRWDGPLGDSLVVAVQAPAVDGKANDAVCRVLAKALAVRSRDLVVVKGQRSRDKLVEIVGASPDVAGRLEALKKI
ncbi:DUF167 domain-containing protein [Prauserella oleivorans]|uniref:UPF0235 protein ACFS2C_19110 n=1 Tax=Prauserella oleivorans TaxID=1478153 RepID=A0ABW5WEF9_9PSEU